MRHTSNELYVDIIENLSVIIAPSGRLISALSHGTIAFNCKVSGIPDLLLTLSAPGGKASVSRAIEDPVFHPCVRLARWRERPGELSFVPPDGRFILASYSVDLLPENSFDVDAIGPNVRIPATTEIRTCLGAQGTDFDVELTVSDQFRKGPSSVGSSQVTAGSVQSGLGARISATSTAFGANGGNSAQPLLETLSVSIPVPDTVRNISDLHATKGEARYSPAESAIEWSIGSRDINSVVAAGKARLRCSVVGPVDEINEEEGHAAAVNGQSLRSNTFEYTDDEPYQATNIAMPEDNDTDKSKPKGTKSIKQNALLMPTSATVSFSVKGWLASGLKVDSLTINTKASKGLGAGVTPYKGVKYLTVSRKSVEVRC